MTYTKAQLDEAEAFVRAMLRFHELDSDTRVALDNIQEAGRALAADKLSSVAVHQATLKVIAGLRQP